MIKSKCKNYKKQETNRILQKKSNKTKKQQHRPQMNKKTENKQVSKQSQKVLKQQKLSPTTITIQASKNNLRRLVQKEAYIKRKYHAIQNFCEGHTTKKPKFISFLEKRHST